jgi:hypothetical protein
MKRFRLFTLAWLVTAAAIVGWAQDGRFSKVLTAGERTDAGIGRLSSNQLAVLDALVRLDLRTRARPDSVHPAPARFSQRLSAEERRNAGLDLLTGAELARVDTLVAAFESGPTPVAGVNSVLRNGERMAKDPLPEIHGTISFTAGAGSGAYTEMGGAITLDYYDPAHDFSVFFGYGEMHTKGPSLFRDGARGPSVRRPVDTFLPPAQ